MDQTDNAVVIQNANILANAAAFACAVLSEIGDTHISTSINGESLTRDRTEQMVGMELLDRLQYVA